MRKTIAIATFAAIGAGTIGVGATDVKGSDTLNAFTELLVRDVLPWCPAASTVTYQGGGSGAGETGLAKGTQSVAPMSRFLAGNGTSGACQGPTSAADAEGLAIAVDGLSIFAASQGTGGGDHQAACDPLSLQGSPDCNPTTAPTSTGLAYSKTISLPGGGSYTFDSWRDVLRVLYFGLTNTDGANPAQSARDCNDPVRQAVVGTWGNLFENSCATGDCTELRHAFRRDENSGTTDFLREALLVNSSAATLTNGFPFCNEHVPGVDAVPACPLPNRVLARPSGPPPNGDPNADPIPGSPGLASPPYLDLYQDNDPIRRTCAGTNNKVTPPLPVGNPPSTTIGHEQVCGACRSLGVVLPISVPQEVPDADRYPTAYCQPGLRAFGAAPALNRGFCDVTGDGIDDEVVVNGVFNELDRRQRYGLCPNGDLPVGSLWDSSRQVACGGAGTCLVPAVPSTDSDPRNDPRCLNGQNNWPAETAVPPLAGLPIPNTQRDGRVYSLHAYRRDGTYLTQPYALSGQSAVQRAVVGAFYRIHTTRTLLTPSNCQGESCCRQSDSTLQLGCLVQASPCSLSFAGREGSLADLQDNAGATGAYRVSINAVSANNATCLTAAAPNNYVLARPLYLTTLVGFEDPTVPADQAALASCYAGSGLQNPNTGTAAALSDVLSLVDFIPLSAGPCCKDFANEACTGGGSANNACANNVGAIPTTLCPF